MQKIWLVCVTVIFLLVLFAFPVAAASGEVVDPAAVDILGEIWLVIQSFSTHLLALVGLILLDVLLGIAKAIKHKKFEWALVADFYYSMVLPKLIGWIGFIIIVKLASAEVLGETYGVIVGDSVVWLAWLAVVATIGASIVRNAKDLYGSQLPFPIPDGDNPNGEG